MHPECYKNILGDNSVFNIYLTFLFFEGKR